MSQHIKGVVVGAVVVRVAVTIVVVVTVSIVVVVVISVGPRILTLHFGQNQVRKSCCCFFLCCFCCCCFCCYCS